MSKMNRRRFVNLSLAGAAGALACRKMKSESKSADAWQKVPAILYRIKPPTFPDRQAIVKRNKASGDARNAIQSAINNISKGGGGRVVVPEGEYIVNGPLYLRSHTELHLQEGATLRFGTNPDDYLVGPANKKGCVLVRWEGLWCYNYSPLIYSFGEQNVAITGKGVIDGQTDKLWAEWYIKKLHMPDRIALRKMGMDSVPIAQRVFGDGHHLAAGTIEFYHCNNILIEGITTRMPLERTIHPVYSSNIIVRDVNVQAGLLAARNDDGIDPDSCRDVLIDNCTFHNYDDSIGLKSGRAKEGWPENGGRPTENVIIRNCTFHGEHNGVSAGSDMSGGIRNIFVHNCRFGVGNKQMYVFNAKSNCDRGGVIEDIYFRDIEVERCDQLMRMEMEYKGVNYDSAEHPFPPRYQNFFFENIEVDEAAEIGINLEGLEQSRISNVYLLNITIDRAAQPVQLKNVKVTAENLVINGKMLDMAKMVSG